MFAGDKGVVVVVMMKLCARAHTHTQTHANRAFSCSLLIRLFESNGAASSAVDKVLASLRLVCVVSRLFFFFGPRIF